MKSVWRLTIIVFWTAMFPGFLLAQEELPEGEGKDLVQKYCSNCHGVGTSVDGKHTEDEWRGVIIDMGVPMSDKEIATMAKYLGKHFGYTESSGDASTTAEEGKVNINKATAKQLETDLEWLETEAAAVIEYRDKHGNFSGWEDLKNVPGLDAQKIEKVKDRLAF